MVLEAMVPAAAFLQIIDLGLGGSVDGNYFDTGCRCHSGYSFPYFVITGFENPGPIFSGRWVNSCGGRHEAVRDAANACVANQFCKPTE